MTRRRQEGQGLVQLVLVIALIAIPAIVGVVAVNAAFKNLILQMNNPIHGTLHGPLIVGRACNSAWAGPVDKIPTWQHPSPKRPDLWVCFAP